MEGVVKWFNGEVIVNHPGPDAGPAGITSGWNAAVAMTAAISLIGAWRSFGTAPRPQAERPHQIRAPRDRLPRPTPEAAAVQLRVSPSRRPYPDSRTTTASVSRRKSRGGGMPSISPRTIAAR